VYVELQLDDGRWNGRPKAKNEAVAPESKVPRIL